MNDGARTSPWRTRDDRLTSNDARGPLLSLVTQPSRYFTELMDLARERLSYAAAADYSVARRLRRPRNKVPVCQLSAL